MFLKKVTHIAIANHLHISASTVGRALRDEAGVKRATRVKIVKLVSKLNNVALQTPTKRSAITIYDIAVMLNLSPSTVSRALTGKGRISGNIKSKVLATAMSLGYSVNEQAKALSGLKTIKGENITIYDIANKLNVSVATVSRALNDKNVKPDLKKNILNTALSLGYAVNPQAKALRSSHISKLT